MMADDASSIPVSHDDIISMSAIVRDHVIKIHGKDTSVLTARSLIRVLRNFGIFSRPVSVRLYMSNPVLTERMRSESKIADSVDMSNGEYAINIDYDKSLVSQHLSGRLVVVVNEEYLVDAALDQANQPRYDVNMDILAVPVEPGWGHKKEDTLAAMINGCGLFYTANPKLLYGTTRHWADPTFAKQIVHLATNEIHYMLNYR